MLIFRLAVDMDIHGYIRVWASDLGYTVDIFVYKSSNLNCHITNFEHKLIPLAIQFSLRT